MTEVMGRRERKKAATRKALADAALELFLARGFDQVTVAEIADAADVSVTTLFKHFPSKEALVFDQDADREAALVSAIRDRAEGVSAASALRAYLGRTLGLAGAEEVTRFRALVDSTPALREYSRNMWLRHEDAVARAVAETTGADPVDCAALAHFALAAPALARRQADPGAALDRILAGLERGWPEG